MHEVLRRLEESIADAIGDLCETEMQAHPPWKWTIQQIAQHLVLTYQATETVLVRRIEKGRSTQARPSLSQHCAQLLILRFGYFPGGLPAPAQVTPAANPPAVCGADLASSAAEHLKYTDTLLDRVGEMFGERSRSVTHMRLGPLSPGAWRQFHFVHGLHHVRQIQAIRKAFGFRDLRRPAGLLHP